MENLEWDVQAGPKAATWWPKFSSFFWATSPLVPHQLWSGSPSLLFWMWIQLGLLFSSYYYYYYWNPLFPVTTFSNCQPLFWNSGPNSRIYNLHKLGVQNFEKGKFNAKPTNKTLRYGRKLSTFLTLSALPPLPLALSIRKNEI